MNDKKTNNSVLCKYDDGTYEIPGTVFTTMMIRTQCGNKRFVRYKEGAYLYSMSDREFFKLAHDAEAIIKRNAMVLVDTAVLDKFMEFYRG